MNLIDRILRKLALRKPAPSLDEAAEQDKDLLSHFEIGASRAVEEFAIETALEAKRIRPLPLKPRNRPMRDYHGPGMKRLASRSRKTRIQERKAGFDFKKKIEEE